MIATRILHVINGEDYAGAERVQDQLALRLSGFGFETGFVCVKPGRFESMRQAQHVPLHHLGMRGRWDLTPVPRLAQLIRRDGYSLVHTHTPRSLLIGCPAALLAGVPVVHHIHSQTSVELGSGRVHRFHALVERTISRQASGVIAVSESLRRHLRERGYEKRKIWLVPNGVPSCGALVKRAPQGSDWTLGTVALFRPRKGIEVLLEAVAILRQWGFPVRLRAVGRFQSEAYGEASLRRARELRLEEAIDWVGFTQDVTAELARMDVFVLPSLISEAMPMSILEAMGAGVPIVGTRVDGVTDLIREGVDGLLAAPGDPHDLASAIKRIFTKEADRERMRAAAHDRQRSSYSVESMAAGVSAVYREVLA